MGKFTEILKSFSLKETLNPEVWDNYEDVEKSELKPDIRKALLKIAEKFIDYLGDDVFVDDITLTGSLANFNWSKFSDFDLHILIDFQQYEKESEVYKKLYDARKFIFNESHNIKIRGYDVELYAQDIEEPHTSSGLYSVMKNEWLNKPKKEFSPFDKKVLVEKIDCWVEKIKKTIESSSESKLEKLQTLKDKIKEYRKSGLDKDGELSYENLVFKFLRRAGWIEKLINEINDLTDKQLSIENNIMENVVEKGGLSREEITKKIQNSKLLTSIKDLVDNGKKYEYSPGLKIPYDENVEFIQNALEFLGHKLPKWGVDGKFGEETKKAVFSFQDSLGLNKDGVVEPEDLKYLLATLVMKDFSDNKTLNIKGVIEKKGKFSYIDVTKPEGFQLYAEICQKFIDARNSDAGVTGQMMAECAKRNFSKGYVPPELALAQLALEGGLSKNPNVRPRRTKNPFNVGNTDSGKNKFYSTVQEGVCGYYDLMTRKYLTPDKTADDLLKNFVNDKGYRYASGTYEPKLKEIVNSVSKYSEPLFAKYGGLNSTSV
jgi:hypothetical protein